MTHEAPSLTKTVVLWNTTISHINTGLQLGSSASGHQWIQHLTNDLTISLHRGYRGLHTNPEQVVCCSFIPFRPEDAHKILYNSRLLVCYSYIFVYFWNSQNIFRDKEQLLCCRYIFVTHRDNFYSKIKSSL